MKNDLPPLAEARVTIIGLGLIGGSLALALRPHCAALLGADPNPRARLWAQRHANADLVASHPAPVLSQADVVLLATPVSAILQLIPQLPRWTQGPTLVLDVGSTKTSITASLARLPKPLTAIGGHPMAGKAVGGAEHAEAALFRGAPFALVELPNTTVAARRLAQEIVTALGAHPVWIEAEAHDEAAAAVSHLPYLLALTLVMATPTEAAPLIGPGFRSATRLAASPPRLMADIVSDNLPAVRRALTRFRHALDAIETALEQPQRLSALFSQAQRTHALLLQQGSTAQDRRP